jgi:hypothetical protein
MGNLKRFTINAKQVMHLFSHYLLQVPVFEYLSNSSTVSLNPKPKP